MATIAPMGVVNVVQSFPAHLVLNILHKFLIHFMSCVFPGHFTTLVPYSSKIASLFGIMTGSQVLFENIPSSCRLRVYSIFVTPPRFNFPHLSSL